MRKLPTGTVTFLFTDVEGSTKLWELHPNLMRSTLAQHEVLLGRSIERNGGVVFKTIGDAVCAAFKTAPEALAGALAAQLALVTESWPAETPIRVRMAIHTGTAEERGGDYFGRTLNRVARLMSAAHGGQTLLSGVAQELTRDHLPEATSLMDLGRHRLKDLGSPEAVFQLLHPGLPVGFPPLKSLDNPQLANNLPQQTTSFIGREKEVGEIKTLMNTTRLLTLTGSGGSGKSRLSLQVAADLLTGDGDGVWLVELASIEDPVAVVQEVADVVGVREALGKPIATTLRDALKEKRLLLILDNCEHVVAACAILVTDLLRSCPNIQILASSRESLNVAGEQTYRVPSLSIPGPKQPQTADSLSQYEAVRLFIERAKLVQPAFGLTDHIAPAVAQICIHLDGIPMALELAAARVRSLSVEEINSRLDNRFRLLTSGNRTALPRQQTLRALVDWSYDLLTAPEKMLLCRVSVFAGGWTLTAAETVCAGESVEEWEVLDLLTALVDKSLVAYEEPSESQGRYRLLETVREYAADRLEEQGETDALRDRHLSWCLAMAAGAAPHLRGVEAGTWLTRLEDEHDNLRSGLEWAARDTPRGLRLATDLAEFWLTRGYWSEGRSQLSAALARAGAQGKTEVRARALNSLSQLNRLQGDTGSIPALNEEMRAIYREIGDRGGEADSLHNMGNAEMNAGALATARKYYEQAVEIYRSLGDLSSEAITACNLGVLARMQGELEEARSLFERVLAIYRENGDCFFEGVALYSLGNVRLDQGEWDAAGSYYDQSLAICHEIGNRALEPGNLFGLASVKRGQGDWEAARLLHEQSLAICRERAQQDLEAENLLGLAMVAREIGQRAEARSKLATSLTVSKQFGSVPEVVATIEEWAALSLLEGDAVRAVHLSGAAQSKREAISSPLGPERKEAHMRTLSAARAALEDVAFKAAWEAGLAMTLDEAVEYALEQT